METRGPARLGRGNDVRKIIQERAGKDRMAVANVEELFKYVPRTTRNVTAAGSCAHARPASRRNRFPPGFHARAILSCNRPAVLYAKTRGEMQRIAASSRCASGQSPRKIHRARLSRRHFRDRVDRRIRYLRLRASTRAT